MFEIFAVPPDPDPEPDTPTMSTEAFATVRITVLGEDTCPQNWWLCCPPPPPEPIPERPTGFVPLDQYDLAFTYPLKSSRKLFKDSFWDGCITCGPGMPSPTPTPPEPEPEPVIEEITLHFTNCGDTLALRDQNNPGSSFPPESPGHYAYIDWYNELDESTYVAAIRYEQDGEYWYWDDGPEYPCCNPESGTGILYLVKDGELITKYILDWHLPGCY